MKKIFSYLFVAVVLLFPLTIKAINIDSVDIDVYLDKSGNAHVTEKWVNPEPKSDGTEFYKTYDNLGEMKISDYNVTYNNQNYTYVEDWDIDKSFSEKAFKNGIYYEDTKTELCFGITNYSSGTYVLTYTINNFVVKLDDADMIYFNFIPSGNTIDNFHLKMHADERFNDKLPVWGYGRKNGTAYVYDGYIEMNSEGVINDSEYITLLAKFDNDTFSSTYVINKDFDYYLKMAKKGSSTPINSNPVFKIIKRIIGFIFGNLIWVFFIVISIVTVIKNKNKIGMYRYDFGKMGRKLPKEVNKMRDIPFDDIYKVYYYSVVYFLNKKKTDLLGAVLLKWLKDNKISLDKGQTKVLKKEEVNIVLNKDITFENDYEKNLFTMLYEASGDGVLESKEFEKWCKKNYSEILSWFDDLVDNKANELLENNLLTRQPNSTLKVSDKFIEEAVSVKGVKEFLLEFSRIDEKEAIEVKLWDMYLIYAQIFGIADKVAKQFKKLYPNEIAAYDEKYGYGIDDIIFISAISNNGISSAISSKTKAESYSSGGGGFMSGGGGGGSFGGGGSMGSR